MTTLYILTAQLFVGGFTMMPMSTEAECLDALAGLPPAVVQSGECYPIEMIAHSGSRLAPEMAPLPPPKPKRGRLA